MRRFKWHFSTGHAATIQNGVMVMEFGDDASDKEIDDAIRTEILDCIDWDYYELKEDDHETV